MHLLIGETIDDVSPRALEPLGPLDVVLFVEPRLEFDDDGNLLFVLRRGQQRADDR